MPRFRTDLDLITPYTPGRSIDGVAAELGIADIAKLASNECPFPTWPEVVEAIAAAGAGVNRYPDNDHRELRAATASHLQVPEDHLWFGGGSSDLLRSIGITMGGPGTSTVYATPSFVLYRIITRIAGSEPVEVPLTTDWVHDPQHLVEAVRDDTTLLYLCNPNNPTGTHLPEESVRWIIDHVPEQVLVVVDEAYLHYADAPDFASAVPLALDRDNVVVTHTFSKVYGLAGLRVGYAVGIPETLGALRKPQTPFPVTAVGQAAATEALRHQERVVERSVHNARERSRLALILDSLGVERADSQTNFLFHRSPGPATDYLPHGVIVRPGVDGWVRTTIGLESENDRFVDAVQAVGDIAGDFSSDR
jgi:histidinol-phosphate aminotransferase